MSLFVNSNGMPHRNARTNVTREGGVKKELRKKRLQSAGASTIKQLVGKGPESTLTNQSIMVKNTCSIAKTGRVGKRIIQRIHITGLDTKLVSSFDLHWSDSHI
jgi:hypothetical protein